MKKLILVLLAVLAASIATNIWQCSNEVEPSVVVEHDTVWRDTTIYEPQPAETVNTGGVVYIRVPYTETKTDTVHDSIEVPIPIVQKRYDDGLYTAWVSGFEPNLDSINLRLPTITETVTKTIVRPSPRLSLGIQAGGGIGIFGRHPDVYVGVGLQWILFGK